MGIGIPGSGKSTVLRQLAEKYDYTYISSDEIRKELTGNETDQSRNKQVWEETYKRITQSLQQGKNVVLDRTFVNDFERTKVINFARENGAEKIQGIFVDTPIEISKERNMARERKVPEHVIDNMNEMLKRTPPEITDGFDSLFTLDEYQELKEAEMLREGEILKKGFKK